MEQNLVQLVTTAGAGPELSFINGALVPAGTLVTIDAAKVDLTSESASGGNLAEVGDAPLLQPVAIAAIAPTGPNPTMPQQVPPGAFQTPSGYALGGAQFVAEGSDAAKEAAATEGEFEEEGTNGLGTFDPIAVIDGNVDTASARLEGLTVEQLDAVAAAENAKGDKARSGLISAIDAAKAKLETPPA